MMLITNSYEVTLCQRQPRCITDRPLMVHGRSRHIQPISLADLALAVLLPQDFRPQVQPCVSTIEKVQIILRNQLRNPDAQFGRCVIFIFSHCCFYLCCIGPTPPYLRNAADNTHSTLCRSISALRCGDAVTVRGIPVSDWCAVPDSNRRRHYWRCYILPLKLTTHIYRSIPALRCGGTERRPIFPPRTRRLEPSPLIPRYHYRPGIWL